MRSFGGLLGLNFALLKIAFRKYLYFVSTRPTGDCSWFRFSVTKSISIRRGVGLHQGLHSVTKGYISIQLDGQTFNPKTTHWLQIETKLSPNINTFSNTKHWFQVARWNLGGIRVQSADKWCCWESKLFVVLRSCKIFKAHCRFGKLHSPQTKLMHSVTKKYQWKYLRKEISEICLWQNGMSGTWIKIPRPFLDAN